MSERKNVIEESLNIPSIIDSIPDNLEYKSVTDRYFSRRYCIDSKNIPKNDYLLLFHSNRICLITLAPSHPFFLEEDEFTIDFQIGKVDRLKNSVKGKAKRGGQILDKMSTICNIKCKNGSQYAVTSNISGKLIEVNEALINSPELLRMYPDSDGYIAAVLSQISVSDNLKNELLTHDEYLKAIAERPN